MSLDDGFGGGELGVCARSDSYDQECFCFLERGGGGAAHPHPYHARMLQTWPHSLTHLTIHIHIQPSPVHPNSTRRSIRGSRGTTTARWVGEGVIGC